MRKVPINREVILSRLEEIRKNVAEIEPFQNMEYKEFLEDKNFAVAEHFLRRALEAIFDIGSHILSRIPGARAGTYKEIAILLGKRKIVPQEFAQEKLTKMAGYRNRLIHFYLEVTEEELLKIIKEDLVDIEEFSEHIKKVLMSPEKYGLTV